MREGSCPPPIPLGCRAPPLTLGLCPLCPRSEEAKSTTWLHPVTGEAVVTGHRRQSTGKAAQRDGAGSDRAGPDRDGPKRAAGGEAGAAAGRGAPARVGARRCSFHPQTALSPHPRPWN